MPMKDVDSHIEKSCPPVAAPKAKGTYSAKEKWSNIFQPGPSKGKSKLNDSYASIHSSRMDRIAHWFCLVQTTKNVFPRYHIVFIRIKSYDRYFRNMVCPLKELDRL